MSILTENAMLVHLCISIWTGQRSDQRLAREIQATHQINGKDDVYLKALVPMATLAKIREAGGKLRTFHHKMTLAWYDGGMRLLPVAKFFEFQTGIAPLRASFESACQSFLAQYPDLVEQAKIDRGTSFDAVDYPSLRELEQKFEVNLSILPLPNTQDFRIDLPEATIQELKAQAAQADSTLHNELRTSLRAQVFDRLTLAHRACTGAKFQDKTIDEMPTFFEHMRALNLIHDPLIDQAVKYFTEHSWSAAVIRTNGTVAAELQVALDVFLKELTP